MEPTCLTGFQERWNQTSESHREAETEGQRVNSVDRNSRPSADKTNIAMENPNHKWRFSSLGKSSVNGIFYFLVSALEHFICFLGME